MLLGEPGEGAERPNVLRLMFHPDGLRPHVVNWRAAAETLIRRAHREAVGGVLDPATRELLEEILGYPGVPDDWRTPTGEGPLQPVVPVTFAKDGLVFSYFSTVTTFGTPQDVLLQELRIECFFPLDEATRRQAEELAAV